ncbi:UvrD-helicase domain-containing protein, partial [Flavobacterium sp.]|uniref:UvrD-helicase domain-containing protein n=1 Tax=Flavobacterium sp. TaxID=239 RepID=UPI002CEC6D0D
TSEMQWQNLIPLIDNALAGQDDLGQKGTLMIVGDPKQSIYRWRGGKAEQFIELSKDQNPFSNPDKKLEHLEKNYRSYSQIVEFNNDFFQFLSNEFSNADYKNLYENHSHQKINNKVGGYVNISFLPKIEEPEDNDEETLDKTQQYVLATLNTIQKVTASGFEYKDIVILTRKRSQGIAIANYLTEQSIPLLSSETLMIQNATEVRLIIHILRYLKNSSDLESKANFLQYLAQNKQTALPVHDFIAGGMEKKEESAFEKWLVNCNVELSFENIRKKSLYEAVEIIIAKFLKSNNNPNGVFSETAYVQYFLDLVLERDVRSQAGISDFLNYWDKNSEKFSIPSPEGTNAVRVMTIHKSKGLEFPVVIMPFADEDYNRKPKDKLWLNSEEHDFDLPKVLVDNSSIIEEFGAEASLIYNLKKQEELLDNINVLYVALTRAEEQLYIISENIQPRKDGKYPDNMASFFVKYLVEEGIYDENRIEYSFGNLEKLSENEKHIDTTKNIPVVSEVMNPKNIKIAQKEALMWGTHQQEAIEFGNVIHEILSLVETRNDVDLAINKAIENGLITILQKELVTDTIYKIVNHQDLLDYFANENEVFNEKTIIQKEKSTIKPDRIVINKRKEAFLLDYKTGSPNPKYKYQLENYQEAIEKMGFSVLKKALVYIGVEIDVVHL